MQTKISEHIPTSSHLPQVQEPRNDGIPLDLSWVKAVQANTSAIERRAASLPGRRSVKKDYQAAWLCKAISLETAVDALRGTGIPVAAVSTGFPAGLSPFHLRIAEIGESVAAGAEEIDIVISRRHVLTGNWQALYDEMAEMRAACGNAHVKAILATGELGSLRNVARASVVCMMAGADFIKTSTGKESVNATLPVTLTMIRAIRDYHTRTGLRVGYKPAGGISKAKDALVYLSMIKDELGDRWLQPDLFRFGASSLLGDIERQLEHHVTGGYSAGWRHAIG